MFEWQWGVFCKKVYFTIVSWNNNLNVLHIQHELRVLQHQFIFLIKSNCPSSVFVPEGLYCASTVYLHHSVMGCFYSSLFWDSQHKHVDLNVSLYANRCRVLQFMRNAMAVLVPKFSMCVCVREKTHMRTRASCPYEAFVMFWFNLSALVTGLDVF